MGLIDKLQYKLEVYRLEQRYTRRKNRTTFVSEAQYVDGEYIYSAPKSPSASSGSNGSSKSARVRVKELAREIGAR